MTRAAKRLSLETRRALFDHVHTILLEHAVEQPAKVALEIVNELEASTGVRITGIRLKKDPDIFCWWPRRRPRR